MLTSADADVSCAPSGSLGRWGLVAGIGALAVALLFWWSQSHQGKKAARSGEMASAVPRSEEPSGAAPGNFASRDKPAAAGSSHGGGSEAAAGDDAPADSLQSGSLLDSFASPATTGAASGEAKSDEALEASFHDMVAAMDKRSELKRRMFAALAANDSARITQLQSEGQTLGEHLNRDLSRLESDLRRARERRPDDPLVQWLTGELLMQVGGEPAEMLPYFQRAVEGGLERPRLFASLARVQLEANRFAAAYDTILKAFERGEPEQYAWETYAGIAWANGRFDDLVERLDAAFPNPPERPSWVQDMRNRAVQLTERWQRESKFREADRIKDDLPRVRLTVEHRRFADDGQGNRTSQIETTGRGEVVLELFEDQAPKTVANFISLVEKGFYDGTLFMAAESAAYVRGGDPNTKNDDPSDDGQGGPGYVIPDEFAVPDARDHFHGSLSMVNTGPHTAGSQFFITLSSNESFNGHFTVFGRVLEGRQVVDEITSGRTTGSIGHSGKLIPGDILVKAEVIRKRPHEYVPPSPDEE